MAAATAPRKTVSIYDYPEHLNPFHEEDNHNKIRFWTLGRRLNRSNSISFSGLKDLKNSWALRSFMKKGKKGQQTDKSNSQLNGEASPIVYRRALQYSTASRSTVGSPERTDRYVYGGSITPLPRSRFQERLRSTSHHEVNSLRGEKRVSPDSKWSPPPMNIRNTRVVLDELIIQMPCQPLGATPRLARSEVSGSRLSVESTNPFEEDGPIPPVRASRRKKKRAPPPPPGPVITTPETTLDTTADSTADTTVTSIISDVQVTEHEDMRVNNTEKDLELEELNLNIELKIVEDEDDKNKQENFKVGMATSCVAENNNEISESSVIINSGQKPDNEQTDTKSQPTDVTDTENVPSLTPICNSTSEEDIHNSSTFRKIDIVKYRRNSSVNEDDIRLRRGNLEDFQSLSNKRSKSLTNALDTTYMIYDINLNDSTPRVDSNGNEEPQKVVCKLYNETPRKQSIETISSTEKEFLEIDRATRELEREINKLNSALNEEELPQVGGRLSVSEIKRRFDKNDVSSPNPIPKPRRSHYGGGSNTP